MKKLAAIYFIASIFLGCKPRVDDRFDDKLWKGTITLPDQQVSMDFDFKESIFQPLVCKISIPQQSIFELQASQITSSGDSLRIEFKDKMVASYCAKIEKDYMTGEWRQGGYTFPLNLKKSNSTIYQSYVEYAISLARQKALNADLVNWEKVREHAIQTSANITSVAELSTKLPLMLKPLGDKHGFLLYNNKSYGFDTNQPENVSQQLKRAAYGHDKKIVFKQMENSTGYLRIPKSPVLNNTDEERYNQEIQKLVCQLLQKNTKNWIIDLRLNYGGNMFQMLAGLNNFFGDANIGAYTDGSGKQTNTWSIRRGNFFLNNEQLTQSGIQCSFPLKTGKTAILIGPITASSGEAVAIAFRGLSNVKIFGEPTKGLSTSLRGYSLGRDMTLFLSTGYYTDRKGHIYKVGITPDINVTGGDNFEDIQKDEKVITASRWINE